MQTKGTLVSYNGDHKIAAIKAVRFLFDVGLKEAKDCIEVGFMCTYTQALAVAGAYYRDKPAGYKYYSGDWHISTVDCALDLRNKEKPHETGI